MKEQDITICGHGSGNPSTKNLYTYLESRYNAFSKTNGKRKGLVSVRRLKALTEPQRALFHDTYKTILGRNIYSQSLRDYVYAPYKGAYYSDCSSSGCATYRKVGCEVSNLNTAGIYQSGLFESVPVNIVNGHIMNPEVLKVGDALLFVGDDPSRPLQIGHVEFIYDLGETIMEETPISGVLTITADELNIRETPNGTIRGTYKNGERVSVIAKSGTWFKTSDGWISRKYTVGWILESNRWWYINNGSYPMMVVETINGADYAFDKDGWLITSDRIDQNGAVVY